MYKIAICDDEKLFVTKIQTLLHDYCAPNSIIYDADTYLDSDEMMEKIEESKYYDMYILDIEMPVCSGLDLAERIRAHSSKSIIILVTAYDHFAIDSFEFSIFRYIPKRYLEERLPKALKDAFAYLFMQRERFYIISNNRRFERIDYDEIFYIYHKQKNTIFVLGNDQEKFIRKNMSDIFKELNSDEFVYIDRCYIINLLKVKNIADKHVLLTNGTKLTASPDYYPHLKSCISLYWEKKI